MPGASLTSSIISLFTYVQNLGATVNLPKFELPETFVKVINIFSKFLFLILNYLPKIPAFDIRMQLVFLALGIPLVLDIIFIWFVNPIMDTIIHLFDILSIMMLTFMVVEAIITKITKGKIFVIVLAVVYFLIRLLSIVVVKCMEKQAKKMENENQGEDEDSFSIFGEDEDSSAVINSANKKENLNLYVTRICDLFMTTVVPGVKSKFDIEDLQQAIKTYSRTVVYEAKRKTNKFTVFVLFVLMVFSLLVGLWSHQIINISGWECPSSVRNFLPYLCYVFTFLFFVFILLNVTQCGRNFMNKFKHFANRWGLRLLMLFLDLLYIPVITNLVTVLTPEHFTCGEGYYLQYSRHKPVSDNSVWFPFVNHTWDCLPCYPVLVSTRSECAKACSGKREWRILGALNLLFFDDVLVVNGGIILFVIVAFLIGIPVLWRIIIRRNRSAIKRANVYGNTFDQKWSEILGQLSTTGIFLFFTYKINSFNWSLVLIFMKLLVMIITTIAGRINSNVYWALPVLYFVMLFETCCTNPNIFALNQFLDLILYLLNFCFSVIPLLPIFGYTIPQNIILYISIGIIAIPVLATIIMLLCKSYPRLEGDPTFLTKKEIKKIKKQKKKQKKKVYEQRPRLKPKKNNNEDLFLPMPETGFRMYNITEEQLTKIAGKGKQADNFDTLNNDSSEDDNENPRINFQGEDPLSLLDDEKKRFFYWDVKQDAIYPNIQDTEITTIKEGQFDSIEQMYHVHNFDECFDDKGKSNGFYQKTKEFTISKRVIYNRSKRMYEMIDIILDGATIELLTKTLNGVMIFGGFAFGWFLGALFAKELKSSNIFCG